MRDRHPGRFDERPQLNFLLQGRETKRMENSGGLRLIWSNPTVTTTSQDNQKERASSILPPQEQQHKNNKQARNKHTKKHIKKQPVLGLERRISCSGLHKTKKPTKSQPEPATSPFGCLSVWTEMHLHFFVHAFPGNLRKR